MLSSAYKLSFPCPHCGGILSMSSQIGEGNCPLCSNHITVSLNVQKNNQEDDYTTKRGWDSRAFRRPAATSKPMWQPLPQNVE